MSGGDQEAVDDKKAEKASHLVAEPMIYSGSILQCLGVHLHRQRKCQQAGHSRGRENGQVMLSRLLLARCGQQCAVGEDTNRRN